MEIIHNKLTKTNLRQFVDLQSISSYLTLHSYYRPSFDLTLSQHFADEASKCSHVK